MHAIPRREAIRRLGLLIGGALSASTVAGLLGGCRAEPGATYTFRALSSDQQALVGRMADLIIPDTDTPGARAAGVPGFIDKMLADWMDEDAKNHFLAGLAEVDARAQREHGSLFMGLADAQQTALVAALDEEAFSWGEEEEGGEEEAPEEEAAEEAAAGAVQSGTDAVQEAAEAEVGQPDTTAAEETPVEEEAPAEEEATPFFNTFKELTVAGYYTSEIGATEELRWSAVPGRFDADIPFADGDRIWA